MLEPELLDLLEPELRGLLEPELRGLEPELRDEPPELLLALARDEAADLLEPRRALASLSASLRLV